jgi:hypothetical protein
MNSVTLRVPDDRRLGRSHVHHAPLCDRCGYRMPALEELIDSLAREGAVFMTMEDAAQEAQARLRGQ